MCIRALVLVGLFHVAPAALAADTVEAERDLLIARIARGEAVAESVAAFARLHRAQQKAAQEERARKDDARAAVDARKEHREAYLKSRDRDVDEHCGLSVDPGHPLPSPTDRRSDWGRVVDKRVVSLRAKNPFAGGADETVTYYTVSGKAGTHLVRGEERSGWRAGPLEAARGDLVLVCWNDAPTQKPGAWDTLDDFRAYLDERVAKVRREDRARGVPEDIVARQRVGAWALKLAAPPRIAAKGRWNPVHVDGGVFYRAIGDAAWPKLASPFVLAALEIDGAAEGGRWQVVAHDPSLRGSSRPFLVEVPATTTHREALLPGVHVWAILGRPRFDLALRRLVLIAEDLEPSYIEAPSR